MLTSGEVLDIVNDKLWWERLKAGVPEPKILTPDQIRQRKEWGDNWARSKGLKLLGEDGAWNGRKS